MNIFAIIILAIVVVIICFGVVEYKKQKIAYFYVRIKDTADNRRTTILTSIELKFGENRIEAEDGRKYIRINKGTYSGYRVYYKKSDDGKEEFYLRKDA